MTTDNLMIGRIPYANLFPIFYILEHEADCSRYTFIEGVPSRLNRMLREGGVDISPSSSLEYLRHPGHYSIIDNNSISSRGEVGSILFFTPEPIQELDGKTVFASSQSETSVALLKVILGKFYALSAKVEAVPNPEQRGEAFLLIGDDALKYHRWLLSNPSRLTIHASRPYDLGEIWYRQTGLPFVFALWILRNDLTDKKELVDRFTADLDRARESALRKLPEIARHAPILEFMTKKDVLSYWEKLDYDFSDDHRKGLALFDEYRKEIGA